MLGKNFIIWWPPSWGNWKFENYRETSRKPDAGVTFYKAKNSFTIPLMRKCTFNISCYNNSHFS